MKSFFVRNTWSAYLVCLIAILIIPSCASTTNSASTVAGSNQCLIDYTVTYAHKAVPDWYSPPEGFCTQTNSLAVPGAMGVYPLKYVGTWQESVAGSKLKPIDASSKMTIEHEESWFYVVWNCHGPCNLLKQKKS